MAKKSYPMPLMKNMPGKMPKGMPMPTKKGK